MEAVMDKIIAFGTEYGISVIGAILILLVGRITAGVMRSVTRKVMRRAKMDEAVISFASSFVYIGVMVFAILAMLSKFGVQTASFVAVLGAAGFAIGFALQGSLGNFAAGVLILVFRPFKIGDYVEVGGVAGSVKEIRIFSTILATPDNVKMIVPNGKIYGDIIKNYAGYDTRRVDMVIGIGYGESIQEAYDIIAGVLKADQRILDDPAVQIAVSELADSSVNFVVRPWVKKEDYWNVKFDVTRKIKEELDRAGIEIPFPQRSIHMVKE